MAACERRKLKQRQLQRRASPVAQLAEAAMVDAQGDVVQAIALIRALDVPAQDRWIVYEAARVLGMPGRADWGGRRDQGSWISALIEKRRVARERRSLARHPQS